jgi:hypothetical protein
MGNFVADGSFYKDSEGYRIEFTDGSPYKNELHYSFDHLLNIKSIVEKLLKKDLPKIRQRGNRFVLSFRSVRFAKLLINNFGFFPGDKSKIIDIPKIYKNSGFESDFWRGYLDGDGSIARDSRRVAVESMSHKIINSFVEFLEKNVICFSRYKSKRQDGFSHVALIKSVSFRDFARKIGFLHPLKRELLIEKLKKSDFFINNSFDYNSLKNRKIEYPSIFDKSIYLVDGNRILSKYGCGNSLRQNVPLQLVASFLKNKGLADDIILDLLSKYRFKKSKGSTNSVKIPLYLTENVLKIAKFVRVRSGGITFSKSYITSFGEDYEKIVNSAENLFDLKPKFTCKNEPLFCSGVLADFFNALLKNKLINRH